MASLIVPRPIALVTTIGADGVVNAAPFSMFNMLGEEPPIVMISVTRLQDGVLKDTAANIVRTGEFVVHLADEDIARQVHRCGDEIQAISPLYCFAHHQVIGRAAYVHRGAWLTCTKTPNHVTTGSSQAIRIRRIRCSTSSSPIETAIFVAS